MASTDARPIPIKNTAYRVTFPILNASGDLVTGATGLDSEISKDAGTFADCTNEATEIASSSGIYYLDLTSTEMNADCVAIIVKTSSSGAKTTPIILYPQESGDIKVDVQSFGGTAGTFASGRPEVNMTHIAGSAVSTSSAQLGVNVVNAAGTAWGSGAITAASIATDAIGAAELAADAATEIATAVWAATTRLLTAGTNIVLAKGTGVTGFTDLDAAAVRTAVGLASANLDTQLGLLATAANLATVAGYVDTEVAAIKAKTDNLPSDPADASDIAAAFSTVNGKLDTIDDFLDTEIAAIKAKTDQMTFTVTGVMDANIQYVNAVLVTGDGDGTPWGP